jgi:Xaa-Pro aminopeptidase
MNESLRRLSALRALMLEKKIDAYIIPSSDPHLGEYIPDHWRIILWLTGFTGSAATVVVTGSFAGLWTDSRYLLQAENQLYGSGFSLVKPESSGAKDYTGWLKENINEGNRIALDGKIFSVAGMRKLKQVTEDKNILYDFDCDLISVLWNDRPLMPQSVAYDHSIVFCGKERSAKIAEVREQMKEIGADYHFLTSLDDIMWLLNIRGNDLKYSPLLISYAIIDENQILFFADENKIPLNLAAEFDKLGIVLLPYEETGGMLSTLAATSSVLLNPSTTSAGLFNSIPAQMRIIEDLSIPARLKAVKNGVEINNICRTMVKDGVALTRFFYWLEHNYDSENISELSAAEKLDRLRSENENYLSPSFLTIIAYNEHGALPHYSPTPETSSLIGMKGIFLVDSGGQYLDGTTDITRTIALGRPSEAQKSDFTLVLKGAINLALAKFPYGTKGYHLDLLARKALWESGLNYGHGTGHGVGFCLNVHEGPQNIGPGTGIDSKTVIEPGMLISDEPALYREGEYGIRIENLVICFEDEVTEYGKFLRFDTVSLCYIDKSLINISLLDRKEIDWLNSYHQEVYSKLSPFLSEQEKLWLKEKTSPV